MSGSVKALVVAGPSGVGKSTLIHAALEQRERWVFSISATTRAMREGEMDGREYYFLSPDEFDRRVVAGDFLEYANVYGNRYGTPRSEFDRAQALDKNLLIEVDTIGCLSIRALLPELPLLAVLPPDLAELKRRLRDRATESESSLALRFSNIVAELQRMRAFDFVLVNDKLEQATNHLLLLMDVIEAGMWRAAPLVDKLLEPQGGPR